MLISNNCKIEPNIMRLIALTAPLVLSAASVTDASNEAVRRNLNDIRRDLSEFASRVKFTKHETDSFTEHHANTDAQTDGVAVSNGLDVQDPPFESEYEEETSNDCKGTGNYCVDLQECMEYDDMYMRDVDEKMHYIQMKQFTVAASGVEVYEKALADFVELEKMSLANMKCYCAHLDEYDIDEIPDCTTTDNIDDEEPSDDADTDTDDSSNIDTDPSDEIDDEPSSDLIVDDVIQNDPDIPDSEKRGTTIDKTGDLKEKEEQVEEKILEVEDEIAQLEAKLKAKRLVAKSKNKKRNLRSTL